MGRSGCVADVAHHTATPGPAPAGRDKASKRGDELQPVSVFTQGGTQFTEDGTANAAPPACQAAEAESDDDVGAG